MTPEMTVFVADVLESIKQAKRIASAQDNFIKKLMATPQTPAETIDEFNVKNLDIRFSTIDLNDSFSHHCIEKSILK